MPQKGQITSKKQYGFWCYSHEEWGIVEWKRRDRAVNQEEGPFNTFSEAKKNLLQVLCGRAYDYRKGAANARKLKKSDVR